MAKTIEEISREMMRQASSDQAVKADTIENISAKMMREVASEKPVGEPTPEVKPVAEPISLPRNNKPIAKPDVEQILPIAEKATEEVVQQVDTLTINDNPGSLRSKMAESLKFFAPDLIGAAIGGIFGGTEAAYEGIQAGGKIRKELNDYNLSQDKLNINKTTANKFQKSENIKDSRTGEPLGYSPVLNAYVNQKGQVVPSEFQEDFKQTKLLTDNAFKAANLEQRRISNERLREQLDFTKAEKNELSDTQVEKAVTFDKGLDTISRTRDIAARVNTGPLAGRTQEALSKLGWASKDFVKLRSSSLDSLAAYVKSISGAAVSEQEAERLAKQIPTVNDPEKTFNAKLEEFERSLLQAKKKFLEGAKKYQGKEVGNSVDAKRARLEELRRKAGR